MTLIISVVTEDIVNFQVFPFEVLCRDQQLYLMDWADGQGFNSQGLFKIFI